MNRMQTAKNNYGCTLKQLGMNRKMFTKADGTIVFVSYSTPIAVKTPAGDLLLTTKRYSVSTSKHRGQFIRDALPIGEAISVDQETIDQYAAGVPCWL